MTDAPTDLRPLIIQGNVLAVLASMPRLSVHCSIFSPPFWGLRRYDVCGCAQDYIREEGIEHPLPRHQHKSGAVHEKKPDPNCQWCNGTGTIPGMETLWGGDGECGHIWAETPPRRPRRAEDEGNLPSHGNYPAKGGRLCTKCGGWIGSLGLENTPQLYVDHMVMVFRALRPVLRDDASVWCELGDTYLTHPAGLTGVKRWKASTLSVRDNTGAEQAGSVDKRQKNIREGNLALVPHRVAIALQEDGWIVRQDNVWGRPNPMPESVKNRSTRSHSYVFLIAKEPGYYYDQENGREAQRGNAHSRGKGSVRKTLATPGSGTRFNSSYNAAMVDQPLPEAGRNMLSVWRIPTQAFPGKHYATFPLRIPDICIGIGTSDRGCCPECGAQFERITSLGDPDRDWQRAAGGGANGEYTGVSQKTIEGTGAQDPSEVKRRILEGMAPKKTVGWGPSCSCYPDPCDRCGKPWQHGRARRRVSEFSLRKRDAKNGLAEQRPDREANGEDDGEPYGRQGSRVEEVDVSWPSCDCRAPVPATVLDPFAGSGTTLVVGRKKGRRVIGIELSPYYVDMATRRLAEAP